MSERSKRVVAVGLGLLVVALFFGEGLSQPGLWPSFRPPFTYSAPGEANLWLAHAYTLTLGAALLGYGLAGACVGLWTRLGAALGGRRPRRATLWTALGLGVASLVLLRLGRWWFLRDLAVTDDEHSVRFGGRLLAAGKVYAELDLPWEMIPTLFLYPRGEGLTSFDFPGGQLFWAAAEVTGLGEGLFYALGPATVVGVFWVVRARLSPGWGAAAALMLIASPLGSLLAMTTHAQSLSRAGLAVYLALHVRASRRGRGAWALAGLAWGAALLVRPGEVVTLSAPLLIGSFVVGARADGRRAVGCALAFAAGAAPAAAVFAWHNWAVTGSWWALARYAPNPYLTLRADGPTTTLDVLGERFGDNISHNLLRVSVFFLGPLGVGLVALGTAQGRLTALLMLGVALDLFGLGLIHSNFGVHVVGPIHQSEMVVPLTVVAVYGLRRACGLAERARLGARQVCAGVLVTLVVSGGVFIGWHGSALRAQSSLRARLYERVDGAAFPRPAVVLVPRFYLFWRHMPEHPGSWVFELRALDPLLEARVLMLRYTRPDAPRLARERFPERDVYVVEPLAAPPYLELRPAP